MVRRRKGLQLIKRQRFNYCLLPVKSDTLRPNYFQHWEDNPGMYCMNHRSLWILSPIHLSTNIFKYFVTVFVSWSLFCLVCVTDKQVFHRYISSQVIFYTNPDTVYFPLFIFSWNTLTAAFEVCMCVYVLVRPCGHACKPVCTCIHDKTARTLQTVLQIFLFCTLIFQKFQSFGRAWMDLSW